MMTNNEWLAYVWQHYHILSSLVALAGIVAITIVGKKILFSVPAVGEMRQRNREKDKPKWKLEKYPPVVRSTQKVGLYCNIVFFLVLLPFCITFETQAVWKVLLDSAIILLFLRLFLLSVASILVSWARCHAQDTRCAPSGPQSHLPGCTLCAPF